MSSPNEPTIVEALSQALDDRAALIGVCMPGTVTQWNRTEQTARVRPAVLKSDGSQRPITIYVPVVFPGVYWDVQVGEQGLLIIADEDWHTWWRTGEDSVPESSTSHELQNAFFLAGIRPQPNPRSLQANTVVVPRMTIAGEVHLGTYNANKAVVHEDLHADLKNFLSAFDTWAAAVGTATGVGYVGLPVQLASLALQGGFYVSPSVMVED